jgi:hypothetical protein
MTEIVCTKTVHTATGDVKTRVFVPESALTSDVQLASCRGVTWFEQAPSKQPRRGKRKNTVHSRRNQRKAIVKAWMRSGKLPDSKLERRDLQDYVEVRKITGCRYDSFWSDSSTPERQRSIWIRFVSGGLPGLGAKR